MKRQTKLAFDMLEKEMEVASAKEQESCKGGDGGGNGNPGSGTSGDILSLFGFTGDTSTGIFGGFGGGSSGSPSSGSSGSSGNYPPPPGASDPFWGPSGGLIVPFTGSGGPGFNTLSQIQTIDDTDGSDNSTGTVVKTVHNIFDVGGASADYFGSMQTGPSENGVSAIFDKKSGVKIGTMTEISGGGVEMDLDGSMSISTTPSPIPFSISVGKDAQGRYTFGISVDVGNDEAGIEGAINPDDMMQAIENSPAFSIAAKALESIAEYGAELAPAL